MCVCVCQSRSVGPVLIGISIPDRSAFLYNVARDENEMMVSNNDGLFFFLVIYPHKISFILKKAHRVASHMLEHVEFEFSPKVIAVYLPNVTMFVRLFRVFRV